MACSNCNTSNCGCSGTYTVSQTCPPACSEVFNTACVVYTGVDITCPDNTTGITSTVVSRNDYLDTALTKIINYFCGRFTNLIQPTTVVQPADAFVVVDETVSNSVTTYSVGLDIAAVAAAVDGSTTVVEAGGTNVTVDETVVGTVTTYTVTAQGTDVVSGDDFIDVEITQNGDDDIVTLTLDINEVEDALGEVSVAQGTSDNVVVTTVNNFPTTGDTQYRLDVVATDVVSTDPILTVVQSGGISPDYDQVFTLDLDDTLLGDFIMDTAGANIIGNGGIVVTYDAIDHEITISETIGLPNIWFTLGNAGVDADISAASNTDTFNITADAVTDGLSVGLAAGPGANEATFTIVNEDRGTAQDIFKTIDCANGGVDFGTITAGLNADNFGLNGGSEISLSILGNDITIDCDITSVFSNIAGDVGNEAADTVTDTVEIVGATGSAISTAITGTPGVATLEIDWAGNTIGAGLLGTGLPADPLINDGVHTLSAGSNIIVDNADPQNPIVSTRANATVDDATVTTQDITATAGNPGSVVSLTHNVGVQYAQIRVIANTVLTGSFVANQDITSDFAIIMTGVDAYTLESTTYTGNVRVIVVGTV